MRVLLPVACSAVILAFAGGAAAQGKAAPKAKVTTPKTTTVKSAPVQKSHATGHTKTTGTAKVTGQTKTVATTTKESPKKSTTTATVTTTGTTTTLTPVQQKLLKNTNLAAKLESRLPPGTNLNTAAADFTSLGQFVSAVNVSHNLSLDFTALKTAILTDGMSLGQAIQAQKTTVDGATVAAKAEKDADTLIKSTESSIKTRPSKTKTDGQQ